MYCVTLCSWSSQNVELCWVGASVIRNLLIILVCFVNCTDTEHWHFVKILRTNFLSRAFQFWIKYVFISTPSENWNVLILTWTILNIVPPPLPFELPSHDDCLEESAKIIGTVLSCIVYNNCTQLYASSYSVFCLGLILWDGKPYALTHWWISFIIQSDYGTISTVSVTLIKIFTVLMCKPIALWSTLIVHEESAAIQSRSLDMIKNRPMKQPFALEESTC